MNFPRIVAGKIRTRFIEFMRALLRRKVVYGAGTEVGKYRFLRRKRRLYYNVGYGQTRRLRICRGKKTGKVTDIEILPFIKVPSAG